MRRAVRLAACRADRRRARRLAGEGAARHVRRMGVRVRQRRSIPTSTTRPSSCSRCWKPAIRERVSKPVADAVRWCWRCDRATARGRRSTRQHASARVRCRSPISARCSIRRPRTSRRTSSRCSRLPAAAPMTATSAAGARVSARDAAALGFVVRPLGREPHLRHVVRGLRAGRDSRRRRHGSPRGRMAADACRTRTAAGVRLSLVRRRVVRRRRHEHAVADRLGDAHAATRGLGTTIPRCARGRAFLRGTAARRHVG